MEAFRGAAQVGDDGPPLILLTEVSQLPNGSWRYTYAIAPGRYCYFTVTPGPAMVSPYDDIYATLARAIAERYPASSR